ncbi:hypothetical protein BJY52DRAFT_154744 [Lactarius psammicola]|nr:hypothetical protein BJY52DRAFT_154744 [Lactarius psammicola]
MTRMPMAPCSLRGVGVILGSQTRRDDSEALLRGYGPTSTRLILRANHDRLSSGAPAAHDLSSQRSRKRLPMRRCYNSFERACEHAPVGQKANTAVLRNSRVPGKEQGVPGKNAHVHRAQAASQHPQTSRALPPPHNPLDFIHSGSQRKTITITYLYANTAVTLWDVSFFSFGFRWECGQKQLSLRESRGRVPFLFFVFFLVLFCQFWMLRRVLRSHSRASHAIWNTAGITAPWLVPRRW